ncbi:MAG TPA: alanine racemase [Sphingomicrobium sp.]|nr:alanine racemase [Sphingomicrobium sp.]
MTLAELETPALLLDRARLESNLARMRAALAPHKVDLRPHLKTAKNVEVARLMTAGWSGAVTVSTLKEADQFFAAGFADILYAVGIAPNKLPHAARLHAAGARLGLIVDSQEAARQVAGFGRDHGVQFPVMIEIDSDGHRAGVRPGDAELLRAIAEALAGGAELAGVMTHGGGSYGATSPQAIADHAELERAGAVGAAMILRESGFACPVVSVGSTPTALFARHLDGVTEVRAGVHCFMDLVMAGLGVCGVQDIAISVLASVIGHRRDEDWLIVDAGWMAMSRDRGTQNQRVDQGYGLVCDAAGNPLDDLVVVSANQEHGIVASRRGAPLDLARFPVGTMLRILPNHACATAAQHGRYQVLENGRPVGEWERFGGW